MSNQHILWQVVAYPKNSRSIIIGSEPSHSQALQLAEKAISDNPHYEAVTIKRIDIKG